jgi:hypothetical protein
MLVNVQVKECLHVWQVGTGARTKVISTQGLASMRDNIITIFGSRTFEALQQLDGETADGIAIEGCAARGAGFKSWHWPCSMLP